MIVRGSLEARKQRQRRRFRLAVVLLATVTSSLLGGCSHTLCAAPTSDFATVSKLINDAIAAHRLPGAVVVIGHGGKVVFPYNIILYLFCKKFYLLSTNARLSLIN